MKKSFLTKASLKILEVNIHVQWSSYLISVLISMHISYRLVIACYNIIHYIVFNFVIIIVVLILYANIPFLFILSKFTTKKRYRLRRPSLLKCKQSFDPSGWHKRKSFISSGGEPSHSILNIYIYIYIYHISPSQIHSATDNNMTITLKQQASITQYSIKKLHLNLLMSKIA